jgi:hypothetical protein
VLERGLLAGLRPRAGEYRGGRNSTVGGCLERVDDARVRHREQCAIGSLGQLAQRRIAGTVVESLVARVDAEDLARVAGLAEVLEEDPAEALGPADADDCNRACMEQRRQILTTLPALGGGYRSHEVPSFHFLRPTLYATQSG